MHITDLSIRRPVTTLMVFVSLLVVGLIATRLVPLEFMPNITFPGAFVQLPYPNSTPTEVNENIARPIEEVLATISGVERINSNSGEDNAGVIVIFKQGNEIDLKAIEIKEKIESIRNQLPDDFEYYTINKFQDGDAPTLQLRISSNRDLSDAYELLNRNLKQRIERIPGVGQVTLYGVEKKEIRIELDPDRLTQYNINLNRLSSTLRQANFSISAGKITDSGLRYMVRPVGNLNGVEDIENLIVADNNIRVKDIATVKYTSPERNYARHLDRKYAIGLDITKESTANTVQVVDEVLAEIDKVNELPEMQGIEIYEMFNQADGILSSLRELFNSGMIGALLSVIVLYIFLRQMSTTLIVATAVPFSLIVTLGFFYFLDISLNILSMMGLMLAIGMLVDNAVVVTENIHRYQRKGNDARKSAILGAKEVSIAVTAGTLTSIIVFLPNVVNESFISQHMYYIGMAIIIALLASLVISLTVIPLLASKIHPPEKSKKKTVIDKLSIKYSALLGWLLERRKISVLFIVLLFLSGGVPIAFMNVDMFPRIEERQLRLQYNLNASYTLDRVKESVDRIEEYLYENQDKFEIESVYTYYQPEYAQSTINLIDEDDAKKAVTQIKEEIQKDLPKIALGQPAFEFISRNSAEQVRVFVQGESMDVLEELAEQVEWRLGQIEGFADVRSEAETGSDEIRLTVNHDRARNFGLTSSAVASMVSGAMRGQTIQRIRGEDSEIDVVLAFQDVNRQTIDDLKNLPISINDDQSVKLATLADFEERPGAGRIFRENRRTSLGISINLDDITSDEARGKISQVMDQIIYPAGYGWSYGRSFGNDMDAMNTMLFNISIAFFLIYLIMASLFESLIYPTSVLSCIFYGMIGIFWFFFITGTTFDLMAFIGILILMGIVVNNGIVLIDHINHLRSEGLSRREAVIQGGRDRMRPILMTAATTVLGLVPLCFGTTQIGGDGPPYFPMARAIVGGLTFSTVVTLLVLPSIYVILDDIKIWSNRILHAAK
ncbi:MAG: efflux RND transporter permease subunit [Gracilimonas sp.]|uniref:efflux RND transporter permease subunit n=1 Tax=Gracilimonas TaxID=649462 RepID=UPI001B2C1C67|nr:efflux RND transporter permease subunit [Gracilimonas sp.]MBO6587123.1 efflux RND transporter permease subunit [Gracilimonas sp.]MBO6614389.1 efflux RND transporter permease subunit [Gracilimonas sp.]